MKSQKGITLTSLVVYIIVMMIVIGVMSSITSRFYQNNDSVELSTDEIIQFNNFNTYFLKEIKAKNNAIDKIEDNYILFKSGNSFSISNNNIYFNNISISKNVKNFTIQQGKDGDNIDSTIVYITISFENFSKSINYKIEEIY